MKGTRLWQGTGSPLIEGRSRQIKPFWQAWLAGALAAIVISLAITWLWFNSMPAVQFALSSALGAVIGVWVARLVGSRRSWVGGLIAALAANAALYVSLSHWFSWALARTMKAA